MGFREIEHLSDRAILVSSSTLAGLFSDAVAGMYAVMDAVFEANHGRRIEERVIKAAGVDHEAQLVGFLSECLNIAELDRLGVLSTEFTFEPGACLVRLKLARILSLHENIKAVTYSQMKIVQKDGLYETIVVFDL